MFFAILGITLVSALGTILGIILPYQDALLVQGLRIISGSIFILFLPGLYLSMVFFHKDEIDMLERCALSFALSISIVPLLMFYVNLLGMPIQALSVYAVTLMVIVCSVVYMLFFQK